MYQRFLEQFTDFIFVEHDLLPSDILFLPGNTFPQMAEEAALLWKTGLAPLILPSGRVFDSYTFIKLHTKSLEAA